MAIAVAQAAIGNTVADPGSNTTVSLSQAYGSNVTQGNLLVVCTANWPNLTYGLETVTDSLGNVWTPLLDEYSIVATISIAHTGFNVWYAIAKSTGACTVTCTFSQPTNPPFTDSATRELTIQIREYSGVDQLVPFDNTRLGGTDTTLGDVNSLTLTVENSGSLVVFFMSVYSTNAPTAGTNYANARNDPSTGDTTNHTPIFGQDRISTPSGSNTVGYGGGYLGSWIGAAIAFRPAGTYSSKPVVAKMQGTSQYNNSTNSVAVTVKGVNAGSLLVAVVEAGSASATLTSVKDQANTSFSITPHSPATGAGSSLWIAYLTAVAGGDTTVTASFGTSQVFNDMIVYEVVNGDVLDVDNSASTQSGTSATTPSLTTTVANDFVLAYATNITVGVREGSGWKRGMDVNGTGNLSEFMDNAAIGTYTPGITFSASGSYCSIAAAFKYKQVGSVDIITVQNQWQIKVQ